MKNPLTSEWTKPLASNSTGNCLQARLGGTFGVQVRDSKLADASAILDFTSDEWEAFRAAAADGEMSV